MYTVRKVRNLAKLKDKFQSLKIPEYFMTIACLLLKKGIIMVENLSNSLSQNQNYFNDPFYAKFAQGKDHQKLQHFLKEDIKVYLAFQTQMVEKFQDEVQMTELKQLFKNVQNQNTGNSIENINQSLITLLQRVFRDTNLDSLQREIRSQYTQAFCQSYLCLKSDLEFPFKKIDAVFDWRNFE